MFVLNIGNLSFEIKLPQFEGPFDLLLFFIERDELDIHDIPIARITADFLDYIHQMQRLNIELASEFILVAATLMRIKARMLLPRQDLDEEGNEIDPRQDLVQKLLEYKRYKEVLPIFVKLEDERSQQEKRGNIAAELAVIAHQSGPGEELETLSLYKLLKVYEKVLKRYRNESEKIVHTVIQYPYSIEVQKEVILARLGGSQKLDFEDILLLSQDKVQLIYNFLAILELIQQQAVSLHVGLGYNNFRVSLKET